MAEKLGGPWATHEEAVAFASAVHVVAITVCSLCHQAVVRINHVAGGACPTCGGELPAALRVYHEVATA